MKLKRLLTYGIMAAFSTAPMLAALETIEVSSNEPVVLDYTKADETGNFKNQTNPVPNNSKLEYSLNVAEEGDYIVYVNATIKLKNGNQKMYFTIEVDGQDPVIVEDNQDCGANWNTYMMKPVKVHLPAGETKLKFLATDIGDNNRFTFNHNWPPIIVHADLADQLGEKETDINVLLADYSSSKYFTSFTEFNLGNETLGQDDQQYDDSIEDGDEKSVAITGIERTKGTIMPVTKLRYLVNVTKEGKYPVTLKGFYVPGRSNEGGWHFTGDGITDFSLNVRATWGDGSMEYSKDVIKLDDFSFEEVSLGDNGRLTKNPDDIEVEGELNLKKGVYYLEISTDYQEDDFFCLRTLTIGAPESTVEDAEPVGQHVPVVTINDVTNVYFGHEFTISGKISLDQEGDKFESATISYGDDKSVNLEVDPEELTFSYTVKADEFKEVGEQTFTVVAVAKNNDVEYKGIGELVVDLQKQVFAITAIARENGTITFADDNNKVNEWDNITATITPNEGYEIASVKVDDAEVEVTPDADGVATYTFENVTANGTIEAEFSLKVYNVSVDNVANGSISTDAADNKIAHGSSLKITVTPGNGYIVAAVIVDGEKVEFDTDADGVATYTVEDVDADVAVSAEFELKKYIVTTNVTGNGTVTVEAADAAQDVEALADAKEFAHGTKIVITATPNEGYKISSITINGEALAEIEAAGHSHTIDSVEADHEIAVTFVEDTSLGIYGVGADGISYSVVDGGIVVRTDAEANVILMDLSGKVLYQGYVNGEAYISTGNKGVNVLKVSSANSSLSVKVVL